MYFIFNMHYGHICPYMKHARERDYHMIVILIEMWLYNMAFVDFAIHTGSTAIPGLTWRPHMCQNFIEQDLDHFFNLFNILLSPYAQRLIFYFLSSTLKELLQCKTCVYYIRSLKFINLTITVFTVCDTFMAHRSR